MGSVVLNKVALSLRSTPVLLLRDSAKNNPEPSGCGIVVFTITPAVSLLDHRHGTLCAVGEGGGGRGGLEVVDLGVNFLVVRKSCA